MPKNTTYGEPSIQQVIPAIMTIIFVIPIIIILAVTGILRSSILTYTRATIDSMVSIFDHDIDTVTITTGRTKNSRIITRA